MAYGATTPGAGEQASPPLAYDPERRRLLRRNLLWIGAGAALGAVVMTASKFSTAAKSSAAVFSDSPETLDGVEVTYATSKKPHIVLITLDDVGWNDLGYQSTDLSGATPYMTTLAQEGVTLTNYYGQASCSPARASLLSGRFVHRTGFQDIEVGPYSNFSLPLSFTLMPEALTLAGYTTYGIGKWNIGHCHDAYLPWNRGFTAYFGYMSAGIHYYDHTHGGVYWNGSKHSLYDMLDGVDTGTYSTATDYEGIYSTTIFRDRAIHDIKSHSSSSSAPLFLWLAFHGMHSDPGNAADSDLTTANTKYLKELYANGITSSRYAYARALMALDGAVEDVVEALKDESMLADAVVVIHSDNGGEPCVSDMAGYNWPLRSGKFQYFEGGVKVPAFVYAPGIFTDSMKGTKYGGLMHHVDWYHTFLSIGKYESAGSLIGTLNSIDHWDAIRGLESAPRNELFLDISTVASGVDGRTEYSFEDAQIVYIENGMKLMKNVPNDTWYHPSLTYDTSCVGVKCKMSGWMDNSSSSYSMCGWTNFLFNVTADPYEQINLWDVIIYQDLKDKMIARGRDEYNDGHYQTTWWNDDSSTASESAFTDAGYYIVPWGCSS